jgi:hypothetical protein
MDGPLLRKQQQQAVGPVARNSMVGHLPRKQRQQMTYHAVGRGRPSFGEPDRKRVDGPSLRENQQRRAIDLTTRRPGEPLTEIVLASGMVA